MSSRVAEPEQVEQLAAPADRRPDGVAPASIAAIATFCAAVIESSRLKNWKTTPIAVRRWMARASPSSALISAPATTTVPSSATSRPAMIDSSVDLPHPDGPVTATNSPRRDGQVDAAQGAHRRRVAVEGPLESPDLDDR